MSYGPNVFPLQLEENANSLQWDSLIASVIPNHACPLESLVGELKINK